MPEVRPLTVTPAVFLDVARGGPVMMVARVSLRPPDVHCRITESLLYCARLKAQLFGQGVARRERTGTYFRKYSMRRHSNHWIHEDVHPSEGVELVPSILLRKVLSQRLPTLVASFLAILLLSVCPRALFASTSLGGPSPESKRPKPPRNIMPTRSNEVARIAKKPAPPRSSRADVRGMTAPKDHPLTLQRGLPGHAFMELSKPEYLKPFTAAFPPNHSSPPAVLPG